MLEIQKFILTHENWRELLATAPYNLKISDDDGFVLFKYNQISSDFSEEICNEARGLILDMRDNFKVVRMAFKKFFNLEEKYAASIDWGTAVANEKIDGSIISVWFARGDWHISTNGTIDGFKAKLSDSTVYQNFGELFESVMPLYMFMGNRWENMCFTFELVSPFNKIVITYPETQVYLLTVRNMDTLEEISYDKLSVWAKELGVPYPKFYYMNDEIGFRNVVAAMGEGHEGIVVRDQFNNRVKIKTTLYFELHRAANNGVMTTEKLVQLVLDNDYEEFLCYFPEYKNKIEKIKREIEFLKETADYNDKREYKKQYNFYSDHVARKKFAEEVALPAGKTLQALLFKAYDTNNSLGWVSSWKAKQWANYIDRLLK